MSVSSVARTLIKINISQIVRSNKLPYHPSFKRDMLQR